MIETKYLIVGNSIAATGCIEGIRSVDNDGLITVISGEKYPAYCRPLISYYLEGKSKFENLSYRPSDFYEKNGCDVKYGVKATSVNKDSKVVKLDNGEEIKYEKLCISTGSSPFVPPFEGLDTVEKKFSFLTIDDSLSLEKAITKDSKVLIIGAGLIGLKCAEGIKERVSKITVCDLATRVLSSILDDECAKMMQTHLEKNGIELLLGDSVTKFDHNVANMKSGKVVDFDILVLAVGVRANIGLVKDAGGETGRGISVSDDMSTSLKDIYAAGDCTEGYDITFGAKRVLAILPNAFMQGKTAGINMAGGSTEFKTGLPMNSIGLFGLHIVSAGSYYGEDQGGSLYEEKGEDFIKRLYVKDDLLTGYILICFLLIAKSMLTTYFDIYW